MQMYGLVNERGLDAGHFPESSGFQEVLTGGRPMLVRACSIPGQCPLARCDLTVEDRIHQSASEVKDTQGDAARAGDAEPNAQLSSSGIGE